MWRRSIRILTHNALWLARLLDKFDPSWIGYFDISHHVEQRVPVKTIIAATKLLRDRALNHHVKYLGRPEDFSLIDDCIPRIEDAGSGVSLTIQSGRTTDDRRLPEQYTAEECIWLLERMRLRCHAIQVFGGLRLEGHRCKAGAELVMWNRLGAGRLELWPCCHGQKKPIQLEDTVFGGNTRQDTPCPLPRCSGYTYFAFGTNFVDDEVHDFGGLMLGPKPPIGLAAALEYFDHLEGSGYTFLLEDLLHRVRSAARGRRAEAGPVTSARLNV